MVLYIYEYFSYFMGGKEKSTFLKKQKNFRIRKFSEIVGPFFEKSLKVFYKNE